MAGGRKRSTTSCKAQNICGGARCPNCRGSRKNLKCQRPKIVLLQLLVRAVLASSTLGLLATSANAAAGAGTSAQPSPRRTRSGRKTQAHTDGAGSSTAMTGHRKRLRRNTPQSSNQRGIRPRRRRRTFFVPGESMSASRLHHDDAACCSKPHQMLRVRQDKTTLRDRRGSISNGRANPCHRGAGGYKKRKEMMGPTTRKRFSRLRKKHLSLLEETSNALRLRLRTAEQEVKEKTRRLWAMRRRLSFGTRTMGVSAKTAAKGVDLLAKRRAAKRRKVKPPASSTSTRLGGKKIQIFDHFFSLQMSRPPLRRIARIFRVF